MLELKFFKKLRLFNGKDFVVGIVETWKHFNFRNCEDIAEEMWRLAIYLWSCEKCLTLFKWFKRKSESKEKSRFILDGKNSGGGHLVRVQGS